MKNKGRLTKKRKKRIRRLRRDIFLSAILCIAAVFICSQGKSNSMIEMNGLSQEGIPTGCESVSTVMILQHLGVDITPRQFIDDFLPCDVFYRKDGELYGPNPEESFAGNPYESGRGWYTVLSAGWQLIYVARRRALYGTVRV